MNGICSIPDPPLNDLGKMKSYSYDDPAFPLLLEMHEKELGFGIYIISEGFTAGEHRKPAKKVVLCPVGDSDAVVKTVNTLPNGDSIFIFQQKCFGVAEGEDRYHAYWHPVSSSFFLDAGSALKNLDFVEPSPALHVGRIKYAFQGE